MVDESRLEEIYPDRFNHTRNTFTLAGFANNISPNVGMIIIIYNTEEQTNMNRDQQPELFAMLRQPLNQHIQFNRFIVFQMPSQRTMLLNIIADLNLELRLSSHNNENGRLGDTSVELLYY